MLKRQPALTSVPGAKLSLEGEIGRRLKAVTEQWILPTPLANPAILEMFRDRDRKPLQNRPPWAGEFAGKFVAEVFAMDYHVDEAVLQDKLRGLEPLR